MKFLIIEDHPMVREWLKSVLLVTFSREEVEIVEAGDAGEAMLHLPKQRWTAILLDIKLPDRSGLDLLRDLRNIAPDSPVLVLSGKAEDEVGRLAMEAGASGFVPKNSGIQDIKLALTRIIAGKKYVTPDLAASIFSGAVRHGDDTPHHMLTSREMEVLRLFGTGCTPTEIGERLKISVKTVSTYRTRILEKLELENTGRLIRYAVDWNLVD